VQQGEWTALAKVISHIASRVELGQEAGAFDQNGITAHFRIEPSPVDKAAETEVGEAA
jgi:hypothetical protein